MADEAVDIPIIDGGSEGVEIVIDKGKVADPASKIVTEDEGVESLKEQVERSKRESQQRLSEADRQIEAARQATVQAQREVVVQRKDTVATVIDSLMKDKETAKRDYIAAREVGDVAKEVDAQERLSMASAKLVKAEEGKLALEEQMQQQPVRRQEYQSDPAEHYIRTQGIPQKSADWIRKHPEFVSNKTNFDAMVGAHNIAIKRGMTAESDEYFSFIGQTLGIDAPQQRSEPTRSREQSRMPASAPVSRDTAQTPVRTRQNGALRLSPDQVKTALEINSDPKATREQILKRYADNLIASVEEGHVRESALDWR